MTIRIRHLALAATVTAGLSGMLSPLAAQPISPDIAYRAPSWWIAAVVEGKQASLLTGNLEADRRLDIWLAGFGYGLGASCGNGMEVRSLEVVLKQQAAGSDSMGAAGQQGVRDGQRFAEINGCTSQAATSARQSIAALANSGTTALQTQHQGSRSQFGGGQQYGGQGQGQGQGGNGSQGQQGQGQQGQGQQGQGSQQGQGGRDSQFRQGQIANATMVRNHSRTRILKVQISETWDNNWGPDRLGSDILESGAAYRIPLQGARSCMFDVRVTYVGSRVEERRNVDLCAASELTFDGSSAQ